MLPLPGCEAVTGLPKASLVEWRVGRQVRKAKDKRILNDELRQAIEDAKKLVNIIAPGSHVD
jgi:hypothetical protein